MRGFVFLAVLVAIVAVVQGFRRADGSLRDICKTRGHIGACSGPNNPTCQSPVTTCIQGGNGGLCCVKPGNQCNETCGGFAGRLCQEREKCIYRTGSTLGDCCKKTGQCPPRPSGLLGPCVFNPDVNCITDSDCEGRKICCPDGCGKVCVKPMGGPN